VPALLRPVRDATNMERFSGSKLRRAVRILVFHGYLLRGTGSNVYNASLAAALVELGHEVHLLCQEPDPWELGFVDAVGAWEGGGLRVQERSSRVRCTVYCPDIHGLLPVYVADRYAGVQARPFPELDDLELDRYLHANVEAVAEVAARTRPDVALANHLVMGPLILARGLAGTGVPYAVKVHGSALEYTVKPHPRFLPHAREGLAGARCVLVGSRHTGESLWEALGDRELPQRTRLGPPGVDVTAFAPRERADARARVERLRERLAHAAPATGPDDSAFARDTDAAAQALGRLDLESDRIVVFVGKLLVAKGVDLLLAAWPLVVERVPAARLVLVGFGAFADGARELVARLGEGDLAGVRRFAASAREGDAEARPLRHLLEFLDALEADRDGRERYARAAIAAAQRVVFTGRLEHDELAELLPAGEALVVPSTFPEAYGMVAAEAAACGVLPVSAEHSGLAEVSRGLARDVPAQARDWLSFSLGARAVADLAGCLNGWLAAPEDLRDGTRDALVTAARRRFSWEGVAEGVIAAAEGRLEELPELPVEPA